MSRLMSALAATALLVAVLLPRASHAQSALDAFDPDADGPIHVIARDALDRIIIGGGFTGVGGWQRDGVAYLHADGSVLTGIAPFVEGGPVRALLATEDGRVVIGGGFDHVDDKVRGGIARLEADGSLDDAFDTDTDGVVHALALDADGVHLYVGGDFASVGAQSRNGIARLDMSGAPDPAFLPPAFTGIVHAIAVQADGRVLVGGTLGLGGSHPVDHRLYRLMPDGTLDPSFSAHVDTLGVGAVEVHAITLREDGRILVGGLFERVNGNARANVARLLENGSVDTSFVPPILSDAVHALALQADGNLLIGGAFTGLTLRNRIARLRDDGELDAGYAPFVDPDATVRALLPEDDGSLVIAGGFQTITGIERHRIARLRPDGLPETDLAPPVFNDVVATSATQRDGRLVVAGWFTDVGGTSRPHMARMLANGALDGTFDPAPDAPVLALAIESDGDILVGGAFSHIGGSAQRGMARLKPDGSADAGFAELDTNGTVRAIELLPDARILVGGDFTTMGGQGRAHLARLLSNGNIDPAFSVSGINGTIRAIAMMSDGRIAIGGAFSEVAGQPRANFAVLQPDGSLDDLVGDTNGDVRALAPYLANTLLVGGDFTMVNGAPHGRIALVHSSGTVIETWNPDFDGSVESLTWLIDGRILVGGAFVFAGEHARPGLALLEPEGTVVSAFNAGLTLSGGRIWSASVQLDGKIAITGAFTAVGGVERPNVARLSAFERARQSILHVPDSGLTGWLASGFLSNGRAAPQMMLSANCCIIEDFMPIGNLVQTGGGWILPGGWEPPYAGTWYLRARQQTGDGHGSGLLWSQALRVGTSPEDDVLFRNGFDPVQ